MSSIREFIKLTRFEHALLLVFAVLISEIITLKTIPDFSVILLLSFLVPVFSEMGSFILNDYLDINTDRENGRLDRPLVKGTLDSKTMYILSWIFLLISTIISYFINQYAFIITLLFNLFAVLYNYKLKDIAFFGNIYIALTMSIPFIFGNFIFSTTLNQFVLFLSILAFFSGLGREIIKSVQDIDGDIKARKSKNLPVIIGKKNALFVSSVIYIVFILISIFLITKLSNQLSMILIFLIIFYFLTVSIKLIMNKNPKEKELENIRKFSLVMLFLGLVAILIEIL